MAWTYSGNPSGSDRDALRFAIQDTQEAWPQFSDEELDYLLTLHGDQVFVAARSALLTLIAKYAREADYRRGQVSLNASQRAEAYRKLLADVESRIALQSAEAGVRAPAVFQGERDALTQDTSLTQPAFTRDPDQYVDETWRILP